MSLKYGLTLLRCFSTDSALVLSLFFFHIKCGCYSKNGLVLLFCNNLLFHAQKGS